MEEGLGEQYWSQEKAWSALPRDSQREEGRAKAVGRNRQCSDNRQEQLDTGQMTALDATETLRQIWRKNKHSSEMEAIMVFKLLELSDTLCLFVLLPNPNETGS